MFGKASCGLLVVLSREGIKCFNLSQSQLYIQVHVDIYFGEIKRHYCLCYLFASAVNGLRVHKLKNHVFIEHVRQMFLNIQN